MNLNSVSLSDQQELDSLEARLAAVEAHVQAIDVYLSLGPAAPVPAPDSLTPDERSLFENLKVKLGL